MNRDVTLRAPGYSALCCEWFSKSMLDLLLSLTSWIRICLKSRGDGVWHNTRDFPDTSDPCAGCRDFGGGLFLAAQSLYMAIVVNHPDMPKGSRYRFSRYTELKVKTQAPFEGPSTCPLNRYLAWLRGFVDFCSRSTYM